MSSLTKDDLFTLDISYRGKPFVRVDAQDLNTETLDISYRGLPFVSLPNTTTTYPYGTPDGRPIMCVCT